MDKASFRCCLPDCTGPAHRAPLPYSASVGKPEAKQPDRPATYADIAALAPGLIAALAPGLIVEILAGDLVASPRPAPRHALLWP